MPTGSCLCGRISYTFSDEPNAVAVCHCTSCRKSSGVTNSLNLMIPTSSFHSTGGKPKEWVRKGDSGKNVIYFFCGECPTLLWVHGEGMPDVNIVKFGCVDDKTYLDEHMPGMEVYSKNKVAWVPTPVFEGVKKGD